MIWQHLPEVLIDKIVAYKYNLIYTNLYKNVMRQIIYHCNEFDYQHSSNFAGIWYGASQYDFSTYVLQKCLFKKQVALVDNAGFSQKEKKIEIKTHSPYICKKQQPLTMNHLIMLNILDNGIKFDDNQIYLKAYNLHNKYETRSLKNNTKKTSNNTSKRCKNYNNKPNTMRNVRKLRW